MGKYREDFEALEMRLRTEKDSLRAYLIAKLDTEDYHGVQDAASDLRDIDCQLEIIEMLPFKVGT